MKPLRLGIQFGALCDGIDEQLGRQNYRLPDPHRGRIQKAADSITYLVVQGLATDAEKRNICKRIMKEIGKQAVPS